MSENHKHEENEIYEGDGLNNHEHILDIFSQIKVLRGNITDNTDLAFNMLKALKDDGEADIVDSLTIFCSEILEQEKQSKDVFERAELLIENSKDIRDEKRLEKVQDMLVEYFSAIQLSEKNSQILIEKVIKNFAE